MTFSRLLLVFALSGSVLSAAPAMAGGGPTAPQPPRPFATARLKVRVAQPIQSGSYPDHRITNLHQVNVRNAREQLEATAEHLRKDMPDAARAVVTIKSIAHDDTHREGSRQAITKVKAKVYFYKE